MGVKKAGSPVSRLLWGALSASLFLCQSVPAQTFRIAGLYPSTNHGHSHCTCGLEAACVTKAAVKRAQKEGLDVSLDLIDKGWTAMVTAEAAQKTVQGGYDAAVGTIVSADANVAARILEKAEIPLVVPTATNPLVTEGKKFVTRIPFSDKRQAYLLAKLTARELKPSRVAVIRNISIHYSKYLGEEYARVLRELSPQTEIKEYTILDGHRDFKTLMDEVLTHRPEQIFIPIMQPEVASIYAELAERRVKVALLASDIAEGTVVFNQTAGRIFDGIKFYFVRHWNERFVGPEAKRFSALYESDCGKYKPSMTGVASYDAINVVLKTLRQHPSTTRANLISRIKGAGYVGMAGPLKYGADGEPIKPLELFVIKGRKTVHWKRYE